MEVLKKKFDGKPIPTLIKQTNIPEEMLGEVMEIVNSGVEFNTKMENLPNGKLKTYCELDNAAKYIKESMDKKFGPTWQCIVGEAMCFDINYQQKSLFYGFASGNLSILLYKS